MWRAGFVVLIGCGRIGFDDVEVVDSAPAPDAAPDAAPVFIEDCVPGPATESFEGIMLCLPWGTTTAIRGATVSQMSGELIIDPGTTMDGYAGCSSVSNVDFSRGGWFQLLATTNPDAATGYVVLHLYHGTDDFAFLYEQGVMFAKHGRASVFDEIARIPFDPIMHRYLRWRPQGAQVIAETAPDARTWTQFGAVTAPAPSMVRPDIGAGTNAPEANPGAARIGGYNTCPGG